MAAHTPPPRRCVPPTSADSLPTGKRSRHNAFENDPRDFMAIVGSGKSHASGPRRGSTPGPLSFLERGEGRRAAGLLSLG